MAESSDPKWYDSEVELRTVFQDEYDLFVAQDRFRVAFDQREEAFDLMIERLTREHRDRELEILNQTEKILFEKVRDQGVAATRQNFIPAYTFTRFLDLPKEIQLRIWFMGARLKNPRNILLLSTSKDLSPDITRIDFINHKQVETEDKSPWPVVLSVCQDSRAMALEVYAQVAYAGRSRYSLKHTRLARGYMNYMYDRFHCLENSWVNYRVFVNMLHVRRGDKALGALSLDNLNFFAKIRILVVDLDIFLRMPVAVWAGFKALDDLTVGFYPLRDLDHYGNTSADNFYFEHAPASTLFGGRSIWLQKHAVKLLQLSNADCEWKIPEIDIVVIRTKFGAFVREIANFEVEEQPRGDSEGGMPVTETPSDSENQNAMWRRDESMISWRIDIMNDEEEGNRPAEMFYKHDIPWYRNVLALLQGNFSGNKYSRT